MKMTAADWQAKGDAYEEAAEHLGLSWTDDLREQKQGFDVATHLMNLAERCWKRARALGFAPTVK